MKPVLMLTALFLSAALTLVYLSHTPFVTSLNDRTADAVMALAPARPASGSVLIVDIDEKSLAHYGQWPWPRSLIAQLLAPIAASGAGSIGLDLILAEPDRASAALQTASPGFDQPGVSRLTAKPPDHDRILAETLAKGPYVLGYAFSFRKPTPRKECNLHPPGIVSINTPEGGRFFTAQSVTCNLPSFSNAVARSGFLNATPDADGILRRVPMLIRFGDDLYPSLALATLMQYEKSSQVEIVWRGASESVDLLVGNRRIQVGTHGSLRVRFSRPAGATPRVSASAVLRGEHAPEQFRDKIVLVGFSAAGLDPTYQTSAGLRIPVEIHAQVLENLLSGERVVRTAKFLHWEVIIGLALAAGAALAAAGMRILPSAALCTLLLAGSWIGISLVFRGTGYLLSPLLPTVLVPVTYAVLTIVKSWLALAEKQQQLENINLSLEQRVADAVSELRKKDQLLIEQGRQAAMGEMISNIAHQWRQPLNMLGLIVQELRLTYGRGDLNKENLDASVAKAMNLIKHMSQTIEDFRNYFKPDKAKVHFKASQAVANTLALAEANLKSMEIKVEVRKKEDADIYGFPNEYSQVLLNILLNCRDAFEAHNVEGQRIITIEVGREESKSVVTITDNAGGIPEPIIGKIFDPYFTTKAPDKGTGIGLYMAKAIIENNMGGRLSVRNTGDGAQFRIEV